MIPNEVVQQQFAMNDLEKKQLSLSKRRIPVNKSSYNLIIGLGGTGCQALIETKGFIELTCENSETHVAYLAFDTDQYAMDKLVSSSETGKVKLSEEEKKLLVSTGMGSMFAEANMNTTLQTSRESFEWVDSNITPSSANKGAGGIRQIGRLIMMKNKERIQKAIRDAAYKLASDMNGGPNPFLNVYILAGIGGGTGSGTIIDMPYLVRETLRTITGFVATSNSIYGYLFMPDVNASQGHGNEVALNRNAYAAFQELEYNLSLQELKEKYTITYIGGENVQPGTLDYEMYDYIHLVSEATEDGHPIPDAYNVAMRAIAQNILSFVADETAEEKDGKTAFAIQSHYDNINGKIEMYKLANASLLLREAKYLAIGSMSYDLPIDDIMMYITSLLFSRMDEMFQKEKDPSAADHAKCQQTIGLSAASIVEGFKAAMPQLVVRQPDKKAFKSGEYVNYQAKANTIYSARNNPEMASLLDSTAAAIAKSICDRFDDQMSFCFKDRERGPVFANHLIVDAKQGLLKVIVDQKKNVTYPAGASPELLFQDQIRTFSTAKQELEKFMGKSDANCAAYNKAGMELYNRYLWYTLSDRIQKILETVDEHIRQKNTALYEFVAQTVISLKDVFANNAQILTQTTETKDAGGVVFNWDRLTIPKLNGYLQDEFKAIFDGKDGKPGMGDQMINKFLEDLWKTAETWMRDNTKFNPRAFVSEYINEQFGTMASLTIQKVVVALLDKAGANLNTTVATKLVPMIVKDSAPLFYPTKGMPVGEKVLLISIPAQCPDIFNAVEAALPSALAAAGVNKYILQKSSINTRIYAQTVQCGITLAHYQAIWNAEKNYAKNRESAGLHLVSPKGEHAPKDFVAWDELCTLIPGYLRPTTGLEPAVQMLKSKEDKRKERLEACIDQVNYTSKHPAVNLQKDEYVWTMELTTTDIQVVFENGELKFLRGREMPVLLKSYNIKDGDQATIAENQIAAILQNGLAAAFQSSGVKAEVRMFSKTTVNSVNDQTMRNLLEEYIRRVSLVHNFEQELTKYEMLIQCLKAIKHGKEVLAEMIQKHMRFTQAMIQGRVIRHVNNVGAMVGFVVNAEGKEVPFVEIQSIKEVVQDWELFNAYWNCLEAKPANSKDNTPAEWLEHRKNAFMNIHRSSNELFDQATGQKNIAACQSYLNQVNELVAKVDNMRRETQMAKMLGDYYGVPAEVEEFYNTWKIALSSLTSVLQHAMAAPTQAYSSVSTPDPAPAPVENPWAQF